MKLIKVVFNIDGSIKSHTGTFAVEGDDNIVKVLVTFPEEYADFTSYRRAEITSTNGNTGVEALAKEEIDGIAYDTLTLGEKYVAAGTTSVTFELVKDGTYIRFSKFNISVNPAVKLNPANSGSPYTVTVEVLETDTVTGVPGTAAKVENKGTEKDVKLKFTIPQGVTFTPAVDENGNLTWTNNLPDGELLNPDTVNIKGPQGDKGDTGAVGPQGNKGDPFTYDDFTAEQLAGLKGDKGDKGDTGATGPKGDKGDKGDTGEKGDKGDTGPMPELANNLTTTESGKTALDAYQGKVLNDTKLGFITGYGDELDDYKTGGLYKIVSESKSVLLSSYSYYFVYVQALSLGGGISTSITTAVQYKLELFENSSGEVSPPKQRYLTTTYDADGAITSEVWSEWTLFLTGSSENLIQYGLPDGVTSVDELLTEGVYLLDSNIYLVYIQNNFTFVQYRFDAWGNISWRFYEGGNWMCDWTEINAVEKVGISVLSPAEDGLCYLGLSNSSTTVYSLTTGSDIMFGIPLPDISTNFYQTLVHTEITAAISINWGTTLFFNGEIPDIGIGKYDFIFEWDGSTWCAGAIEKGLINT